jgi:hypothetical protein
MIHIEEQLTDYVVDLLSGEEKRVVARHVAACEECRRAVQREREIGRLVHSALNSATTPKPARLQSLMPPVPGGRSPLLALLAPYRQWAIACLLLVAMIGAFMFGSDGGYGRLTRTANMEQATLSFVDPVGTAESITAGEGGTLSSISTQPIIPVEHSPVFINDASARINPPAAPLPVAPQVTPAPAATYFQ